MNVWIKVSNDKYELPIAVADTAEELAEICGVNVNNIHSSRSHAKHRGQKTRYFKIIINEEGMDNDNT